MVDSTREVALGIPEFRARPFSDFEVRKTQGSEYLVEGYASLFDVEYPVMGGPLSGGWTEVVDERAFDVTLRSTPDVHFLINHAGRSLARTKSGTLTVSSDQKGLLTEARIDRRTQDGHDLEIMLERGDLDEMSIGFRTVRQQWSDDYEVRRLLEVNLDKGDVSVVNNGANDRTHIRLAGARDAIEVLSRADLVEVRGLDDPLAVLREARSNLDRLIRELTPGPKRLTFAEALRMIDCE